MREPTTSYSFTKHFHERPFTQYLSVAMLGTVLAIVGAWLPWWQLQPSTTRRTWVWVHHIGPTHAELLVVIPALVAAAAIAAATFRRDWQPDLLFVALAAPILYMSSLKYIEITESGRVGAESGLFLVLLGGVFLGIAGLLSYLLKLHLGRRETRTPDHQVIFREFGIDFGDENTVRNNSTDRSGNRVDVVYLTLLGVASLLIVTSILVPWYSTSIDYSPFSPTYGIPTYQALAIIPATFLTFCAVALAFYDNWRPDVPVLLGAGITLYASLALLSGLRRSSYTAVEPGVFLALGGGLLMAGVALYSLYTRYAGTRGRASAAFEI